MKILLLSLVFGLVCAKEPQTEQDSSQENEKSFKLHPVTKRSVRMAHSMLIPVAFDNGDDKIFFKFFVKVNEKCTEMYTKGRKIAHNVYKGNYAGKNELHFVHVSKNALTLYNINVDEEGKKTMIMELIGKGNTAEEQDFKKFKELTRKKGIPEENIVNIIETDDCPRQ